MRAPSCTRTILRGLHQLKELLTAGNTAGALHLVLDLDAEILNELEWCLGTDDVLHHLHEFFVTLEDALPQITPASDNLKITLDVLNTVTHELDKLCKEEQLHAAPETPDVLEKERRARRQGVKADDRVVFNVDALRSQARKKTSPSY